MVGGDEESSPELQPPEVSVGAAPETKNRRWATLSVVIDRASSIDSSTIPSPCLVDGPRGLIYRGGELSSVTGCHDTLKVVGSPSVKRRPKVRTWHRPGRYWRTGRITNYR